MAENLVMGIDIGGSSVKGGIVDVNAGRVIGQRCTIEHQPLPRLARITESIRAIIHEAQYEGTEIGVGFPGVVSDYEVINGPNMGDDIRHGSLVDSLSGNGLSSTLLNDADSALYHAIRNHKKYSGTETILLVTIGTSLGTAVSQGGRLLRNIELGRLLNENGTHIDQTASVRALRENGMDMSSWANNLSSAIKRIASCVSPEIILLGGGITEEPDSWFGMVDVGQIVKLAPDSNHAGLIGAACWHHDSKNGVLGISPV
ncbi:MAG TPA: ROK family protein [Candidatus Poseidoniales archaeon]|nr:MAG TPA: ROK family protein [Candidatus Poseidoniales archaeon]